MNLEKFIGTVPEGTHTIRVTDVEFGKSKKGNPQFIFSIHIPDLGIDHKLFYPTEPSMLWKLTRDLQAAEALREGDSYSDDEATMAEEIKSDLSDRFITMEASKNGAYMNYEFTGVSLAA